MALVLSVCTNLVTRLTDLASTITDVGLSMEKWGKWKSEAKTSLMLPKHLFVWSWYEYYSFCVGPLNESSNVARLGMKSDKFVTIPRKLCNTVKLWGGWNPWIVSISSSVKKRPFPIF